ncbi:MFS transporter [Bordetella bronchialis]|uniref:MFS transporter n=1 Tax=Bordetella bronchialis TaxID=463025 RepID=A0A193FYV5_9BORD|nr:MFS transporter [Bordetella bronchialis]ANN67282.1 MFS transporter [Bordetella bronchialis]ANN72371.1 MFS transporter [Bordetella bronchialis]
MREPLQRVMDGVRRRPVLEVTLACLAVLLLAQALMGALSLSALNRLVADTTADRVEVSARQIAGGIENGLRLGKPLAQFFGLQALLREGAHDAGDVVGVAVILPGGADVATQGDPADARDLARALLPGADAALAGAGLRGPTQPEAALPEGVTRRPSGALMSRRDGGIALAVPLVGEGGGPVGALVVSARHDGAAAHAILLRNAAVLVAVTAAVGLALAAAFRYLVPLGALTAGGPSRFVVPLVALLLAQGVYAGYTVDAFRLGWLQVTRGNVAILAAGLQRDLDRVLGYGIDLHKLQGVEAPFQRLAAAFPAIREIDLVDAAGRTLNRADGRGALPPDGAAARAPVPDDLTLVLPLGQGLARPAAQGSLVVRLSEDVLARGVRSRMLDAATVAVVALVAAVEMLLLLSLLLNRGYRMPARDSIAGLSDTSDIGRIARPVMFGFLFAWAMPLGFLPLYARSLPPGGLDLPPNLLLALPISVEMGCGLLTALLAGRLTDRRGWQVPVLAGLAVSFAGMLACAAAANLPAFAAARGVVGLGYGLGWMGLQGFIVTRSSPMYRGRNMTSVIAGLFAGHLTGAAVGAMLMEQLGFRPVFAISAVMMAMPVLGVLVLMRPYMRRGEARAPDGADAGATARAPMGLARTARLLFTRDFGLMLLGSVIPFSIAQVGLLSFALPLYLEAAGAAASSIGRVLMIYGLCVIYVGPLMGRLVDRSASKKGWIVLGGVIGSAGMLGLWFNSGLDAAAMAVLLLALAGCFSGASQSPYMLALPDVQDYGAAGATSVMRAADKLGQMAGPLMVGALFGTAGMGASLAITGLLYLAATLVFLVFAPGRPALAGRQRHAA